MRNKSFLGIKLKNIFSRVTFLDWILLFCGIFAILTFFFLFKREVVFTTATFKVTDENVLYARVTPTDEFANSFRVGDTEKDEFGQTISEIVSVDAYKIKPEETTVYLDIKLKATYNPRKNQYTVRGKHVVFGESFTFTFTKVKFKALVVDFPGYNESITTDSKTIVKTQIRNESRFFSDVYGVPDFVAYAIKKGDTVNNSKGKTLATILDVSVQPAKRLISNSSGQPFFIDDPYLKDVYLTIELSTKKVGDRLYMFDFIPVIINTPVPINTPKMSIWPIITEIL